MPQFTVHTANHKFGSAIDISVGNLEEATTVGISGAIAIATEDCERGEPVAAIESTILGEGHEAVRYIVTLSVVRVVALS